MASPLVPSPLDIVEREAHIIESLALRLLCAHREGFSVDSLLLSAKTQVEIVLGKYTPPRKGTMLLLPVPRVLAGNFPEGIVYADRTATDASGDYKRLAMLPHDSDAILFESDCPAELRMQILADAAERGV